MRLAHLHIPRLIPYNQSLALQNTLIQRHFNYKDAVRGGQNTTLSSSSSPPPPPPPQPDPTLLTFSTEPTYTVGRRHLLANPISPSQQDFLTADGLANFHASPRGGLLTYHAPGQVTGYVVADLRRHGITARCWVKMLEESVMRTCGIWGVETTRTDDPGVWIKNPKEHDRQDSQPSQSLSWKDRKICAIGVQVSRGITSHGVGLNVFDPPFPSSILKDSYKFTRAQIQSPSYDPSTRGYLSWGFSRIVACGLEGKSVTWLAREGGDGGDGGGGGGGGGENDDALQSPTLLRDVADGFAREVMTGINNMKGQEKESVEEVYRIDENDLVLTTEE